MAQLSQTTPKRNPKIKKKDWIIAFTIVGITLLIGVVGSLLGGKMDENYRTPPLMPPNGFFPVIWTIIYISIAVAAYLTYLYNKNPARRRNNLIWYAVHLFFNLLWPLFFFRLNLLTFACIWLSFNFVSAFIVTCRYYKSNLAAGIIFTGYLIWLIFAFYLNMGVMILN